MKKISFFLLFLAFSFCTNAQERSSSIGISISKIYFKNVENVRRLETTKGFLFGIEYSEIQKNVGFRAGIFYSKFQTAHSPYDLFDDLFTIDYWGYVYLQNRTIDFPLTGQLYLGKKRFKAYVDVGFTTILNLTSLDKKGGWEYYADQLKNDLSIRGIAGFGFQYQIIDHFGIDLGMKQRLKIASLSDSPVKALGSIVFFTKLNYIF